MNEDVNNPKCLILDRERTPDSRVWFKIPDEFTKSNVLSIKAVIFYPGKRQGGAYDHGGEILSVVEWSKVAGEPEEWFVKFGKVKGFAGTASCLFKECGQDNFLCSDKNYSGFMGLLKEDCRELPDLPRGLSQRCDSLHAEDAKKAVANFHGVAERNVEILIKV
ncbi:hypothetical protein ACSC9T_25335 [Pseudomonas putida]|uniref:hypothetical protein n=1 Tax=Pseudomonas putida TaxID=303 RepID=UPI003F4AB018